MHSTAHSDRAAEPMHNPLSDPEAKPRSVFSFGGKERIEDASCVAGGDSATAVSKGDAKAIDWQIPAPVNTLADAQRKASTHGHGFHRVDQQSREYLTNLA